MHPDRYEPVCGEGSVQCLKRQIRELKAQVKELETERTLWMNGEIKANKRVALLEHMIGQLLYAANQAGVKAPKG